MLSRAGCPSNVECDNFLDTKSPIAGEWNYYFMTKTAMIGPLLLRRLDDKELDFWIRSHHPDSSSYQSGIREFRRRQEACHREHDLLTIRVGVFVAVTLASGAFGAVYASGVILK